MEGRHYLLDTNIMVYYYTPKREYESVRKILNNEAHVLHVLEISIPEVISTFYKKCYAVRENSPEKITKDELRDYQDAFIKDIEKKKEKGVLRYLLHSVMARDIKLTDKIWTTAEKVFEGKLKEKKGKKNFLDAFDALLIAYALHLSKTQGIKGRFALLTTDFHLGETAKELGVNVENPL